MDKATALQICADDLAEFGKYDTSNDTAYLPRMMLKAMQEIWGRKPWEWKKSTAIIIVVEDVNGYDLPADFKVLAESDTRQNPYNDDFIYYGVCYGSDNKDLKVYVRRDTNKLYFEIVPDAGSYTLNYIMALTDINSISVFPEDMSGILCELTKSYALSNSMDTIPMSKEFRNSFEMMLNNYWFELMRGHKTNSARIPVSANGMRFHESLWIDGV